jgi:cation diffusion facilitator CzcD-associated flavoprotein CzcO
VEHVVYEKNPDIGGKSPDHFSTAVFKGLLGTWLENRYPHAGCDVPSHAYTYQFALVCFPVQNTNLLKLTS